jgi:hypothetical protein
MPISSSAVLTTLPTRRCAVRGPVLAEAARTARSGPARALVLALLATAALFANVARAATAPCSPCAGVTTRAAHEVVEALQQAPHLDPEARLYVRWRHEALQRWDPAPAQGVAAAGATPWLEVVFHTPAPLVEHATDLERELAGLAAVVREPGPVTRFEIVWEPQVASAEQASPPDRMVEYAFLLKRAAVVITGALPEARVLTGPLPAEPAALRALYGQDIAAYADELVLQGPLADDTLHDSLKALAELDPGRPVSLVGVPWPEPSEATVAEAARFAAAGVAVTLFDAPSPVPTMAPLAVLANETHGDLSYDAASGPQLGTSGSGSAAWAYVRGKDLGLRVIARRQGDAPLSLAWGDPTLAAPEAVSLQTGEARPIAGAVSAHGVQMRISAPVVLLRLGRREAADLQTVRGLAEVQTERQMPVEEILRRLQAFEDAQARRLTHYEATNTTHLRFQGVGEQAALEVTFKGPFFYREGAGFDWAWRELYLNGVKWRGKELPRIPLIQPEKAAAMPLQIHFNKEYTYRLRGTDTVNGRPVWVVDFEPADAQGAASGKLYKGTVWIDREHYGRVRTKGLQVGLGGEVISNEETLEYSPVDASGKPGPWDTQSFWLPLRVLGQQVLSVVNTTTVVEKETLLSDLVLDGEQFAEHLAAVQKSDVTMVRDTDKGLRYLVKQKGSDERVVQPDYVKHQLFLLGGVFWDDSLDYPLPLLGVDYFSFDFKGTGDQANVLFGGALLQANIARPKLGNSKFDIGADAFAVAVGFEDQTFHNDVKDNAEAVKIRPARLGFHLGRPLGSFFHLGLTYDAAYFHFAEGNDTSKLFVVPSSHLLHSVELEARYQRSGYRLTASGSWNHRSTWEPWGLPGPGGSLSLFDPSTQDFELWDVSAAKSWYLPHFQRLGLELDYLDGDNLDRFSKYQFGFFGSTRVHGYQAGKVRAERATAAHVSYGIGIGEVVRLDVVGDVAWATDKATGLKNELLAGTGIAGSFMGPWQTLVQVDLGTPVAGPDTGLVAYVVFLKLFK